MTHFYAEDRLTILHGDAADLPLPDASVDLIVTSPPYFALRSYKDDGEHYEGQLGDEATPAEFVAALLRCTQEWMRVLKPSGSLWVNLGDKYAGSGAVGPQNGAVGGRRLDKSGGGGGLLPSTDVRSKSLIGIPWRYALACIDDLDLILRAEVIWSKPNGLPESVTDRVRRSHEQWFHFTLSPRYYSAVDQIREAHVYPHDAGRPRKGYVTNGNAPATYGNTSGANPLGKLPGSVWEIATQPLRVPDDLGIDHFAAFPMEWPRRIIQGWSPSGVCVACGEGRRPTTTTTTTKLVGSTGDTVTRTGVPDRRVGARKANYHHIAGEVCACDEPTADTTPAVVLDPFGGTGTTALVAYMLGRHGISNDLSADYCRLAQWRTTDPKERARAINTEAPPEVPNGQGVLL